MCGATQGGLLTGCKATFRERVGALQGPTEGSVSVWLKSSTPSYQKMTRRDDQRVVQLAIMRAVFGSF
jgi:hypothetical protein